MSIESELVTALGAHCGDRVFPDVAPTDTPRPYITYQQVGGVSPTYVEGALPNTRNARMQISVWAANKDAAVELILQVEETLVGHPVLAAQAEGAFQSAYDESGEPDERGATQDFDIWGPR